MARYNREFLVPYLNNLCALHLAKDRLMCCYDRARCDRSELEHGPRFEKPQWPEPEDVGDTITITLVLGLLAGFLFLGSDVAPSLRAVFLPLLCACLVGIFLLWSRLFLRYARRKHTFQKAYIAYEARCRKWREDAEKEKSKLDNQMHEYQEEINRIDMVLKQVYSANIIPSMYRNKYAAVYLYDWFGTSGADDLDHALSMYVLEEIKARLDRIIEQQSEMILNQRLMLAKQQESIDAQNRHSDMMRSKLDQLQATEEERLRYERMTEANTAATAYFAAATYLKS